MTLSEDQRALLGLLLAGDTYERVADLLGTNAEDVRERAHGAAAALEDAGDPDLPAAAVRERLAALDGGQVGEPAVLADPETVSASQDERRRRAIWIILGGAAIVLIAVLLVVLAGGGGGDSDRNTTTGADQEEAVPVRLSPVGGSRASGGLTIVRVADQPAVDLDIRGLTPTANGQTYVLWFVGSGGRALPVAFQSVGEDGRITGRTAIPTAAASLLPSFTTADLTLTRQEAAAAVVRRAAQAGMLPERVGNSVLRGSFRAPR